MPAMCFQNERPAGRDIGAAVGGRGRLGFRHSAARAAAVAHDGAQDLHEAFESLPFVKGA